MKRTPIAPALSQFPQEYHSLLRSQLSSPLRKFCSSDFGADFIAESLLIWTMDGKDFDEIYGIVEKLF